MDSFIVQWQGDRVSRDVRQATVWGMNSVMSDCVMTSKSLVHIGKTAHLQISIQMRPTVDEGNRLIGYWGSFAMIYAIWVEQGTQPHVIFPKNKKALWWKGLDHPVRMVFHPGGRPYPFLAPSAEQHYPSLPLRITASLAWGQR